MSRVEALIFVESWLAIVAYLSRHFLSGPTPSCSCLHLPARQHSSTMVLGHDIFPLFNSLRDASISASVLVWARRTGKMLRNPVGIDLASWCLSSLQGSLVVFWRNTAFPLCCRALTTVNSGSHLVLLWPSHGFSFCGGVQSSTCALKSRMSLKSRRRLS